MPPPEPTATTGRRVVVAGWSGTPNLGDELLLRALLGLLAERDLTATVVSRDPAATYDLHGVEAVGLADVVGLMRALRVGAGMVLGPGGILQDETSPFSLPWHLARVAEARLLRRPVVGVGLGVGPLDRRGSQAMLRLAVRGMRVAAVRDVDSAALLPAGPSVVRAGCDLALALPVPAVEPQDRIVVCLRTHRPGGHVVPLRAAPAGGLSAAHLDAMVEALDRLAIDTGLPLHLVAFEAGSDDRHHELVAERLTAPVTLATPGLDDVLAEVAASRLVVATRFHAGVAALLAGRPAALIGYAPKVRSLAGVVAPGFALVDDDPAGYGQLPAAAAAVLGRDDDVAAARQRQSAGVAAHRWALDRLLDPS